MRRWTLEHRVDSGDAPLIVTSIVGDLLGLQTREPALDRRHVFVCPPPSLRSHMAAAPPSARLSFTDGLAGSENVVREVSVIPTAVERGHHRELEGVVVIARDFLQLPDLLKPPVLSGQEALELIPGNAAALDKSLVHNTDNRSTQRISPWMVKL